MMKYCNIVYYNHSYALIKNDPCKNRYTYKFNEKLKLKIDDDVLLPTKDGIFAVGKVVEIFNDKTYSSLTNCSKDLVKEVLGKIDTTYIKNEYNKKQRIKELDKLIEEKAKAINKLLIFESLAKDDETIKELVDEYKKLISE